MITTTLNRIRAHGPCRAGWEKLLAGLGKTAPDDEPLPFARIVEINGIDDALWCCRAEPQHEREWRLFAVFCARQVQHLMTDPCSIAAINAAERHANGQATNGELADAAYAARSAAWAAAWTAALGEAADAADAYAVKWAAWSAADSAAVAAYGAARSAADSAAVAAYGAARSAAWAAAADSAAGVAAWAAQKAEFLRIVEAA